MHIPGTNYWLNASTYIYFAFQEGHVANHEIILYTQLAVCYAIIDHIHC